MAVQQFDDAVEIDGSQDITQLKVQGHSTQTEPLQVWEDSAADEQAQITGDGRLQIGSFASGMMATDEALIEAHRDEADTTKPIRGLHLLGEVSGTLSSIVSWAVQELVLKGSGGISALHSALRVRLTNENTGTMDSGADLRAADVEIINDGGGESEPVPEITGLHVAVTNQAGAYADTAYGIRVRMNDDGDLETAYAIHTDQGVVHLGDALELKLFDPLPNNDPSSTDFLRLFAAVEEGDLHLYGKVTGESPKLIGGGSAKVRISSNDTTPGFLNGKLVAGANITLTENNDGGSETLTIAASSGGGGGGTVIPGLVQGRLTLSSSEAVPIANQMAKTTVYFLPYKGRMVNIFDGISTWEEYVLGSSGINIAIPSTTDTNYDVFVYDNSGLTLELVAWTSGTTRATALVLQDGVYVKSGATDRLYLGTIRTTSTTGECEDSVARRLVWNYYHPALRKMHVRDTSADQWAYTTATWRAANGNNANRLQFVVGIEEHVIDARYIMGDIRTTSSGFGAVGIALDRTDGNDSDGNGNIKTNSDYVSATAHYLALPGIGYHYLQATERGGAGVTFFDDGGGDGQKMGLIGTIWC